MFASCIKFQLLDTSFRFPLVWRCHITPSNWKINNNSIIKQDKITTDTSLEKAAHQTLLPYIWPLLLWKNNESECLSFKPYNEGMLQDLLGGIPSS